MRRVIASLTPMLWAPAASFIFLAVTAGNAQAANPLAPGESLDKPGTVPALLPPYYTSGPIPANYSVLLQSTAFPYSGSFLGSVLSQVWMDPITAALAFSYKFNNLNNGTPNDIVRMTMDDPTHPWTGIGILDTGADGTGSSTPQGAGPFWANGDPYLIERDALFNGVDAQLRVGGRGTELLNTTNDTSSTIWFATDAKHFTITNLALIDSGASGTGKAYAPLVPEPGTILLAALGFAVVGLARLFRLRRS